MVVLFPLGDGKLTHLTGNHRHFFFEDNFLMTGWWSGHPLARRFRSLT
jgi:hypothetical protein